MWITISIVEYDDHAKLFHGDVINTKTVITFQGKSVDEIEQAFRDSVDDYTAWCEEEGVAPEMPYWLYCVFKSISAISPTFE